MVNPSHLFLEDRKAMRTIKIGASPHMTSVSCRDPVESHGPQQRRGDGRQVTVRASAGDPREDRTGRIANCNCNLSIHESSVFARNNVSCFCTGRPCATRPLNSTVVRQAPELTGHQNPHGSGFSSSVPSPHARRLNFICLTLSQGCNSPKGDPHHAEQR